VTASPRSPRTSEARSSTDPPLEPGNIRFDVLQSVEDPTRFILHEWYVDEAAAAAHKETPHYLEWRALAEDWMAEPRVGVRYIGLFPTT
jgi:(4S)-4-hydroxy-5-phosphonooxypentane-2,3-dione isomerase